MSTISGLTRLTIAECAEIARCGRVTILHALQTGELVGRQRVKGGRWLVKPADLEAWMDGES